MQRHRGAAHDGRDDRHILPGGGLVERRPLGRILPSDCFGHAIIAGELGAGQCSATMEACYVCAADSRNATAVPLPRLDIVIVNWNTGPHLGDCLRSVAEAASTGYELGQVLVVDNASTDDSLDQISDLPLPLHVLRNKTNRGFAAACNQGASEGNGEFLLFLNPDTRLFRETLDRAAHFMLDPANAEIGICGARMVDEDGIEGFSCWRFPTLWMWVAKMTGLADGFPRWIPRQRLTADDLDGSGIVDQVIGAFFLIRRTLFEALNGFDERFFVYMEDVDLAYRAKQLGYASYFLADADVYHVQRVSSDQVRGKRLFYLLRGRTEYARKHWPVWQAALLAGLILVIEFPVRLLLAIGRGRSQEIKDVSEAAWRYLRYVSVGR
jgi:N-acetylglucosaminyl-diphospho-decaprenol L-rhamnosyltransferase